MPSTKSTAAWRCSSAAAPGSSRPRSSRAAQPPPTSCHSEVDSRAATPWLPSACHIWAEERGVFFAGYQAARQKKA